MTLIAMHALEHILFNPVYAYPLIFFIIILGEIGIAPLPIPFPSEATLLFAGYEVSTGKLNIWAVLALTIAADALGSIVIYSLVLFVRENAIVKKLIKKTNKEHSIVLTQQQFSKNLAGKIILGRLLPYVRLYTSIRGGIMEVPFAQFGLFSVIASTIWCTTIVLLGWHLSKYTLRLISTLSHYLVLDIIGVVCIVGLILYSIVRFFTDSDEETDNK